MSTLYSGYYSYYYYYYSQSYNYMYYGYNYYSYAPVSAGVTTGTIVAIILPLTCVLCIGTILMWLYCCSVVVLINGKPTRICRYCRDQPAQQPGDPNFNLNEPPANYNLGGPNLVAMNHHSIYSPGI